jgi:iron-sulfur cluster assembly protein
MVRCQRTFANGSKIMFDPSKPIVTLSDAAAAQARQLIESADTDILGLRIGIKTAGCSGLQYDVQYATEAKPFEDRVEEKGVTLFIDPTAVMFLVGSEMDWEETKFASRFTFNNPNEAARCGCGESFTVAAPD